MTARLRTGGFVTETRDCPRVVLGHSVCCGHFACCSDPEKEPFNPKDNKTAEFFFYFFIFFFLSVSYISLMCNISAFTGQRKRNTWQTLIGHNIKNRWQAKWVTVVVVGAMFCWKTFGSWYHMDITLVHTTHLKVLTSRTVALWQWHLVAAASSSSIHALSHQKKTPWGTKYIFVFVNGWMWFAV